MHNCAPRQSDGARLHADSEFSAGERIRLGLYNDRNSAAARHHKMRQASVASQPLPKIPRAGSSNCWLCGRSSTLASGCRSCLRTDKNSIEPPFAVRAPFPTHEEVIAHGVRTPVAR